MKKIIAKIRDYFEYRKNKKAVKREIINMSAVILLTVAGVVNNGSDIIKSAIKVAKAAKGMDGEILVGLVLKEVSAILNTDNNRIIEILTYMANLQPADIQKIVSHSIVETMPKDE